VWSTEILAFLRNILYWQGILYPRFKSSLRTLTSLSEQPRAIDD